MGLNVKHISRVKLYLICIMSRCFGIIVVEHILHKLSRRPSTFYEVIDQFHKVGRLAWRFDQIARTHRLTGRAAG